MVAAGALTEEKKRNGKAKGRTEIRNQSTKQGQSNQAHGAGNMSVQRVLAHLGVVLFDKIVRQKVLRQLFVICSIGIPFVIFRPYPTANQAKVPRILRK